MVRFMVSIQFILTFAAVRCVDDLSCMKGVNYKQYSGITHEGSYDESLCDKTLTSLPRRLKKKILSSQPSIFSPSCSFLLRVTLKNR